MLCMNVAADEDTDNDESLEGEEWNNPFSNCYLQSELENWCI